MKYLLLFSLSLALGACSGNRSAIGMTSGDAKAYAHEAAGKAETRHIAYSYQLHYEAPEAVLLKRFEAIEAECVKLGCTILEASRVIKSDDNNKPSGALAARIPPAALPIFLKSTAAANTLTFQTRSSEDKTVAVIDAEAKIKNLTALKTRILTLLETRAGNLADVLAAEAQLAEIQSQLDTVEGVRKMLALETEMVKVDITLTAQSSVSRGSWMAPVAEAVDDSGEALMRSIGMLILFLVSVLPWSIVVVPLIWGIRKLLQKRRLRLAARKSAQA